MKTAGIEKCFMRELIFSFVARSYSCSQNLNLRNARSSAKCVVAVAVVVNIRAHRVTITNHQKDRRKDGLKNRPRNRPRDRRNVHRNIHPTDRLGPGDHRSIQGLHLTIRGLHRSVRGLHRSLQRDQIARTEDIGITIGAADMNHIAARRIIRAITKVATHSSSRKVSNRLESNGSEKRNGMKINSISFQVEVVAKVIPTMVIWISIYLLIFSIRLPKTVSGVK